MFKYTRLTSAIFSTISLAASSAASFITVSGSALKGAALVTAFGIACGFSSHSFAHIHADHKQAKQHSAIGHAPISIMGDHLHKAGEWMVSYRFMQMNMSGLQQDRDKISLAQTISDNGYMMAPTDMTMQMHMLGFMFAPSDDITLMVMTNYLSNDMDAAMKMMSGMGMNNMATDTSMNMMNAMDDMANMQFNTFSTQSSGLGDSRVSALINAFNGERYKSHFTLGLNLPTGDVEQTRTNQMGNTVTLGYPMQLGTDTTHLFAGYTFTYLYHHIQLGSQINYEKALENNSAGYKPGNKMSWHNWAAYSIKPSVSVSARLSVKHQANIKGQHNQLNPMMMPSADAQMRGVSQIDIGLGINYVFNGAFLNGHRVAFEFSQPIKQHFDGIQMPTDSSFMLGWQKAF